MKHDWEYKKLGEVCESDLGKTLNQSKDTGKMQSYLCSINIQWDAIDLSTIKQARFEDSEFDRYSVKSGDLLICEGGDTGRAAIWEGEPMLYQNALHRIRFNDNVNARFALLYLRYLKNNGDIDSKYSKGVTIKHLVKSSLNSIPIPVPPLPTQQSIVSELDSLSKIIADCKETLKDYDALEQSIFYDMFGDPVKNDKGWEVKKLGEVGTSELGKMLDSKKNTGKARQYLCTINVLWEGMDLINVKEMKIEDEDIERYSVKKGDLLICEGGDTGRCAIWENDETICYQNSLHRVRFDQSLMLAIVCKKIFELYKRDGVIENYSKGQTIKHLVKNSLLTIPLPVPPLPLQQQFASKIEAIEKMKSETKAALQETETLFQARMDYWFNK